MNEPTSEDIRADLAMASHILFMQGVLDGFGHVSARDPDNPDRFLISRNLAPALVGPEDIMTLDLAGNDVEGSGRRPFLERFIHGSIYRRRPDVHAIVHSHSPAVLPFTISQTAALKPVTHMSGFIGETTPLFEVRDHGHVGCDMLVRTPEMGDELATCLADHALVLMRGHGVTVVAPSLKLAVFRAVYAEVNARVQTAAMTMGPFTALTPEEAVAADETNSGQNLRAWSLWSLQAAKHGLC